MEKIEGLIKIAAAAIAVIIPCILLAGYSYHLGYIMTYGLSTDLVHKSMSEMLVESWYVGVMAMAWLMSKWPYILSVAIAFFLFFVGVFFFLLRAKEKGVTWPFEEITKENKGRTILGIRQWHWICLGDLFNDIWTWVFTPFAVLALIGLLTAFPFIDSKEYALQQIAIFQEHGCKGNNKKVSCIVLIEKDEQQEKVLAEGILISANTHQIAIYDKKIEVWPLLGSHIIRQKDTYKLDEKGSEP